MTLTRRPYDSEQSVIHRDVVEESFASARKADKDAPNFFVLETTREVREAHGDTWLVFGDKAYKALCGRITSDDGTIFDYMPAHLDGEFLAVWPDEGRGGIMHLMTCIARHGVLRPDDDLKPVCGTINGGWLRTSELNLSPREIAEAVARDQYGF